MTFNIILSIVELKAIFSCIILVCFGNIRYIHFLNDKDYVHSEEIHIILVASKIFYNNILYHTHKNKMLNHG
jgi:hypothetical protein